MPHPTPPQLQPPHTACAPASRRAATPTSHTSGSSFAAMDMGRWLILTERWKYTNVLKLARTINHLDERCNPPVPQIVFYLAGVGTNDTSLLSKVEGAVGAHLADKVQEAYSFIAHNYHPGDESSYSASLGYGAYTARMVAAMIGEIGVLDRRDMDHFADVFMAFQKRGKANDPKEIAELDKQLAPWTAHDSPGKQRADSDSDSFSIKCVGVFDTVGSLGLPEELTHSNTMKKLFGFPNHELGEHIERTYHAMALNETREDFNICKFEQTPAGLAKGQILEQTWFSGSHSDIGGGWQEHDLSDLTLFWMMAHVMDMISLDSHYGTTLIDPVAPWGELPPHDPRTGIMRLTDEIHRTLPTRTNNVTHEKIHPSVLGQSKLMPTLQANIDRDPGLVGQLLPLEEALKSDWPYVPHHKMPFMPQGVTQRGKEDRVEMVIASAMEKGMDLGKSVLGKFSKKTTAHEENGDAVEQSTRLSRMANESSMGSLMKEMMGKH